MGSKIMLGLSGLAAGLCAYSGAVHAAQGEWGWALLMLIFFGLNLDTFVRNLRR